MDKRTIRVRGSAKIAGSPDLVVITFDLESRQHDYEECMALLNQKTEHLRRELQKVGLKKESLKTLHFNINTNFEWVNKKNVFRGYKASHDLKVDFPYDKEYLNQVLHILGQSESEASFNISFQIKDPEPLRQQAIAAAVKNCRQKAEILAEAAGVTLGDLFQIDYSWAEVRFESRMQVCEAPMLSESPAAYDIEPEDVDISDSVTAIWAIK